jgi:hypothetical protein
MAVLAGYICFFRLYHRQTLRGQLFFKWLYGEYIQLLLDIAGAFNLLFNFYENTPNAGKFRYACQHDNTPPRGYGCFRYNYRHHFGAGIGIVRLCGVKDCEEKSAGDLDCFIIRATQKLSEFDFFYCRWLQPTVLELKKSGFSQISAGDF